jgi:Ig-fold domain
MWTYAKSPGDGRHVFPAETLDNYFDLLPGEAATIRVKTSASLDQLKTAMRIISLTDAF